MLLVTLIYSLFTILGVSSILHPVMTRCEVTRASMEARAAAEAQGDGPALQRRNSKVKEGPCLRFKNSIAKFDRYVFSPLFIRDFEMILRKKKDIAKTVEQNMDLSDGEDEVKDNLNETGVEFE